MHALLLSAGFGTRLRPLTDLVPKCLVPIRGIPLLEIWLSRLFACPKISRVIINTHYLEPLVTAYVAASPWADRITLVHESELLGTAGTVKHNAMLFIGEEPLLLAHGDNLTTFDCDAFIAAHAARPPESALTMMTFATDTPQSCGIVELTDKGLVRRFHEKVKNPPGNLANAAVYILEPEVVREIVALPGAVLDFSTGVIPKFLGRISTFANTGYHRDIGTVESWLTALGDFPESCLPKKRVPTYFRYCSVDESSLRSMLGQRWVTANALGE